MLHDKFSASSKYLDASKLIKSSSSDFLGTNAFRGASEHVVSVKKKPVAESTIIEAIALSSLVHNRMLYLDKQGLKILSKKYVLRELYGTYPHLIDYFWRSISISRLLFSEIRKAELAKSNNYIDFDFVQRMPFIFHVPIKYKELLSSLLDSCDTYFSESASKTLRRGKDSLFRYFNLAYEYASYINDISNRGVSLSYVGKYSSVIKNKYYEISELLIDNSDLYYLLKHMQIDEELSSFMQDKFPLLDVSGSYSSDFRDFSNNSRYTIWSSKISLVDKDDNPINKRAYWFTEQSSSLLEKGRIPTHISPSDFYMHFLSKEDRVSEQVDMSNRIFFFLLNRKMESGNLDVISQSEFIDSAFDGYASTYNIVSSSITAKSYLEESVKSTLKEIKTALERQVKLDLKSNIYLNMDETQETIFLLNTIRKLIFEYKSLFPKTKIDFYARIRDEILRDTILQMFNKEKQVLVSNRNA